MILPLSGVHLFHLGGLYLRRKKAHSSLAYCLGVKVIIFLMTSEEGGGLLS